MSNPDERGAFLDLPALLHGLDDTLAANITASHRLAHELAQAVDRLAALVEQAQRRATEPTATVTLDTTAKGEVTIKVSVTADSAYSASELAEQRFDALWAKYRGERC